MTAQQDQTFGRLASLFKRYRRYLVVQVDSPNQLYLDTKALDGKGRPVFFGGVKLLSGGKVALHLMAVYVFPELLSELSPELKKRMQGKSCFNFTSVEPGQLAELQALVVAGYQRYREAGMLRSASARAGLIQG